mgnify:CR=1 FL=1
MKVVVGALTVVLFVAMPLALVLWPLPDRGLGHGRATPALC